MTKAKTPLKLVAFDAARYLDDDEAIAEYMTAVLETNDPDLLLVALSDVARAKGMAVLVTESLPTSLRLLQTRMKDLDLSRHFGTPPVYPVLNSRAQRKKIIEFDQKTRSEIYLRAPQDVEIYRRATELLNQGIQRHLQ